MTEAAKRKKHGARKHLPKGLMVVHEDDDLIVVDKPAGMLTMGTAREKVKTVYYALTNYVRKGNPKSRNRIFIIHRLDRETSGLLVFAKNEQTKHELQNRWEHVRKEYVAVVDGVPRKAKDSITGLLAENEAHRVYSTTDEERGKFARTDYAIVAQTKDRALLKVTLQTGRKHQIRVHLADLGNPVVGDRKYGHEKQAARQLALHAHKIIFTHPTTRQRLTFTAPVPERIERLVSTTGKTRAAVDRPRPGS